MSHTDVHQPITDNDQLSVFNEGVGQSGDYNEYLWHKTIRPRCRREHADSIHMKAQNRSKRHADKQKLKKIVLDEDIADSIFFADHKHDHLTLPRG